MSERHRVSFTVNGRPATVEVPARRLLLDCLREDLRLTGTHAGCEQGVCGACTVILDGEPVRSCLLFAVQAAGAEVETIESLGDDPGDLHPVQRAFQQRHGLQCGFCTPGMVLTAKALLEDDPEPGDDAIRAAIAGNLCRCTGYTFVVDAIRTAGALLAGEDGG